MLLVRSSACQQLLGAGAHGVERVDRGLHRGRVDPGGQRLSHLGDHDAAAVQLLASRSRERTMAVKQTGINQPGARRGDDRVGLLERVGHQSVNPGRIVGLFVDVEVDPLVVAADQTAGEDVDEKRPQRVLGCADRWGERLSWHREPSYFSLVRPTVSHDVGSTNDNEDMTPDTSPRLARLATWQLSQAAARSHKVLYKHLAEAGASGYDYRVLAGLGDLGPLSQADLGRAAVLDRRDVTHTVRDLQARRLVTRRPDPSDGRQNFVELTAAGSSMLERLELVLDEVQTDVFAALTVDQRATLVDLLRQLS